MDNMDAQAWRKSCSLKVCVYSGNSKELHWEDPRIEAARVARGISHFAVPIRASVSGQKALIRTLCGSFAQGVIL